jgi:hypothetical protein
MTLTNFDTNAEFDETITGVGAVCIVELPYLHKGFALQINPTGGTYEASASLNGDDWEAWPSGTISALKIEYLLPVRYVRFRSITATSMRITMWGHV